MINIEHKLWTAPGRRPYKTAPVAVYTSSFKCYLNIFLDRVHGSMIHEVLSVPREALHKLLHI